MSLVFRVFLFALPLLLTFKKGSGQSNQTTQLKNQSSMRNRYQPENKFLEFLKKYGLIILGIFFVYPYVVAYMRKKNLQDDLKEANDDKIRLEAINQNPQAQTAELNSVTTNTVFHNIAKDVYHHLGLGYSWWDPRRWTENDLDIYNILKSYNPIPTQIIDSYYIISSGNNLRNDLQRLLDARYYNLLKF